MNAVENALRWLLQSSADPSEVSLTIKGLLIGVVPVLMTVLGLAHINLGQDQITGLVDGLVGFVQAALTLISAIATLWGILRKIWLTVFASSAQV